MTLQVDVVILIKSFKLTSEKCEPNHRFYNWQICIWCLFSLVFERQKNLKVSQTPTFRHLHQVCLYLQKLNAIEAVCGTVEKVFAETPADNWTLKFLKFKPQDGPFKTFPAQFYQTLGVFLELFIVCYRISSFKGKNFLIGCLSHW